MRATFIASEVGIGLRRNLTMTITVVIVTAISLLFFGAGLLMNRQVETMKDYWYDRVEVSVFLCGAESEEPTCAGGEVTGSERAAIERDLRAMPVVQDVIYESKEDAYEHFKEYYEDSPAITENIEVSQMPESFRIKLKDPEQYSAVAGAFADREGVEQVVDQKQLLETLFDLLNRLQIGAFVLAIIQLVAAALLIVITIRVAAFSRRRETGIMRLVGASSLYIQLPFILEGALAGLLGGLIAIGAVAAIHQFVILGWAVPNFPFTNFLDWDDVVPVMVMMIVLGVALSALASFLTLLKYLRV